jgi:hypothetical protein
VFVALGLNLPFEALGEYFLGGLLVMFVFIFVARPITVLACLLPDQRGGWTGREMAFISWCRETGVIPAAVASLLLARGVGDAPMDQLGPTGELRADLAHAIAEADHVVEALLGGLPGTGSRHREAFRFGRPRRFCVLGPGVAASFRLAVFPGGPMLWPLFVALQLGSGEIVTRHTHDVAYTRTDIESACGVHVIQVRYRNAASMGVRGRVDFFRIDNHHVPRAAAGLQARAANRSIDKIGIMNCGEDERNPVIQGIMRLGAAESQSRGLSSNVFFRVRREDWCTHSDGTTFPRLRDLPGSRKDFPTVYPLCSKLRDERLDPPRPLRQRSLLCSAPPKSRAAARFHRPMASANIGTIRGGPWWRSLG